MTRSSWILNVNTKKQKENANPDDSKPKSPDDGEKPETTTINKDQNEITIEEAPEEKIDTIAKNKDQENDELKKLVEKQKEEMKKMKEKYDNLEAVIARGNNNESTRKEPEEDSKEEGEIIEPEVKETYRRTNTQRSSEPNHGKDKKRQRSYDRKENNKNPPRKFRVIDNRSNYQTRRSNENKNTPREKFQKPNERDRDLQFKRMNSYMAGIIRKKEKALKTNNPQFETRKEKQIPPKRKQNFKEDKPSQPEKTSYPKNKTIRNSQNHLQKPAGTNSQPDPNEHDRHNKYNEYRENHEHRDFMEYGQINVETKYKGEIFGANQYRNDNSTRNEYGNQKNGNWTYGIQDHYGEHHQPYYGGAIQRDDYTVKNNLADPYLLKQRLSDTMEGCRKKGLKVQKNSYDNFHTDISKANKIFSEAGGHNGGFERDYIGTLVTLNDQFYAWGADLMDKGMEVKLAGNLRVVQGKNDEEYEIFRDRFNDLKPRIDPNASTMYTNKLLEEHFRQGK